MRSWNSSTECPPKEGRAPNYGRGLLTSKMMAPGAGALLRDDEPCRTLVQEGGSPVLRDLARTTEGQKVGDPTGTTRVRNPWLGMCEERAVGRNAAVEAAVARRYARRAAEGGERAPP